MNEIHYFLILMIQIQLQLFIIIYRLFMIISWVWIFFIQIPFIKDSNIFKIPADSPTGCDFRFLDDCLLLGSLIFIYSFIFFWTIKTSFFRKNKTYFFSINWKRVSEFNWSYNPFKIFDSFLFWKLIEVQFICVTF